MLTEIKAALAGLLALVLLLAGFLLGKLAYEPKLGGKITAHAQQRQADGSLIAARTLVTPATVPKQRVPAADQPTATAEIRVAARRPQPLPGVDGGAQQTKSCEKLLTCPALQIDETLVKDGKGQPDLIVSGDGVTQASFTPLPAGLVTPVGPWAAGLSYDSERELGIFVDRDLGRLRLGLEVDPRSEDWAYRRGGLEGRIRLGWRF